MHVLALGADPGSDLVAFVEHFKQETAFTFAQKNSRVLWQHRYYDHIVRSEIAAERVARYIWMNPVRKNLCEDFRCYPFSGSLTEYGRERFAGGSGTCPWVPPWKQQKERQKLLG